MPEKKLSASGVKPASLPVGELLDKRAPFRVPRYQRPYAWTDEQVGDFVEDVQGRMDPTASRDHFFGSMVAIRGNDESRASTQVHEIVDGQQRLTTFCLVLAHVAAAAGRLSKLSRDSGDRKTADKLSTLAREIHHKYLFYMQYDTDRGTESQEPRLELSIADNDKYQAMIRGERFNSTRESHRRLQAASDLIYTELVKEIEDGEPSHETKFDKLRALRDAIVIDSFVIHIVTEDRKGGYRLFSVLNDRGARLTVADLLRSHTLEQLAAFEMQQDKAAGIWDEMLAKSGSLVDSFLMTLYPSLTGQRARKDVLFDRLALKLFQSTPTMEWQANSVLSEVSNLNVEFEWFQQIRNGIWPYPLETSAIGNWRRDRLKRLTVLLKHELALPLLLAARATTPESAFADLVHMLEFFAFRYKNICDGHASAPAAKYYAASLAVRTAAQGSVDSNWGVLRSELRKLIVDRAFDYKFKVDLADKLRYDRSSQRGNIKEFLTTLDDYWGWLSSSAPGKPKYQPGTVIDLDKVSIEHIYPQNASTKDAGLESLKHNIGNLSFWDPLDNIKAANNSFLQKLPSYASSKVRMNQELAKLSAWDASAQSARKETLLNYACKVFVI